jgi:chemotaxis protein MotB
MAKKKKKPDPPDSGGADFMTLFTALSVILLAFFILLTSVAVIDDSKKREALGSLRGSFGILPGGMALGSKGKSLERTRKLLDEVIVLERLIREMEVSTQARQLGQKGDIALVDGGAYPQLRIASHVLYPNGGTEISPRAFPILDRIAEAAEVLDREMDIEGHTANEVPAHSKLPTTWELSTIRAINVQRYMITAAKVDPNKVQADGMGHHRPPFGQAPADRLTIVFRKIENPHAKPDKDQDAL